MEHLCLFHVGPRAFQAAVEYESVDTNPNLALVEPVFGHFLRLLLLLNLAEILVDYRNFIWQALKELYLAFCSLVVPLRRGLKRGIELQVRANWQVSNETAQEKLSFERVRLIQVIKNVRVLEGLTQLVQVDIALILLERIHLDSMLVVKYVQLIKLCLCILRADLRNLCYRD